MITSLPKYNSLIIKSSINEIHLVEDFLEPFKTTLDDSKYFNLYTCVYEAVVNSIKHGNASDIKKTVILKYEIKDNTIDFFIHDEGKGFDFNNIIDPTLPERINLPNGRGIHLIKHLTHYYQFLNKGSILQLQFLIND